jgi:hypothetical protein
MTKKLMRSNKLHSRLVKQYNSVCKAVQGAEHFLDELNILDTENNAVKDSRAAKAEADLSSIVKRKTDLEARINLLETSLRR